jgi:hypothetical protein
MKEIQGRHMGDIGEIQGTRPAYLERYASVEI